MATHHFPEDSFYQLSVSLSFTLSTLLHILIPRFSSEHSSSQSSPEPPLPPNLLFFNLDLVQQTIVHSPMLSRSSPSSTFSDPGYFISSTKTTCTQTTWLFSLPLYIQDEFLLQLAKCPATLVAKANRGLRVCEWERKPSPSDTVTGKWECYRNSIGAIPPIIRIQRLQLDPVE